MEIFFFFFFLEYLGWSKISFKINHIKKKILQINIQEKLAQKER